MLQRWYGNTEGYHKSSSCVLKAKRKIKELSLSKAPSPITFSLLNLWKGMIADLQGEFNCHAFSSLRNHRQ